MIRWGWVVFCLHRTVEHRHIVVHRDNHLEQLEWPTACFQSIWTTHNYLRNCHLFLHNSIQQAVEVHEEAHHLPAHVQTHTNLAMRILSSTSSYLILKLRSTQLKFVKFLLIFAFLTMCLRSCPALWISAGSYSPGETDQMWCKRTFQGWNIGISETFITSTYISPWNKVELTDEPNTNLEV